MTDRIERVRVTNRNPFTIHDMCDGVPYEFPSGMTVVIPLDAAQHFFGFPGEERDMQLYMARRFGWNQPQYYAMPKDEQAALLLGVPFPSALLPWQNLTRSVTLSVEHYEMRRVHAPGAPIPAEEAAEAPDTYGLSVDPPAPRRTVVGRRRSSRGKRQLRPRTPAPAPAAEPLTTTTETTEA